MGEARVLLSKRGRMSRDGSGSACRRRSARGFDKEYLEEERARWVRVVPAGVSVRVPGGGEGMFGRDVVEAAMDDDIKPLDIPPFSVWKR